MGTIPLVALAVTLLAGFAALFAQMHRLSKAQRALRRWTSAPHAVQPREAKPQYTATRDAMTQAQQDREIERMLALVREQLNAAMRANINAARPNAARPSAAMVARDLASNEAMNEKVNRFALVA